MFTVKKTSKGRTARIRAYLKDKPVGFEFTPHDVRPDAPSREKGQTAATLAGLARRGEVEKIVPGCKGGRAPLSSTPSVWRKLEAAKWVPEDEAAKRMNETLKALDEDARVHLLDILLEDICPRCYSILSGDRCWGCYESPGVGED